MFIGPMEKIILIKQANFHQYVKVNVSPFGKGKDKDSKGKTFSYVWGLRPISKKNIWEVLETPLYIAPPREEFKTVHIDIY